MELHACLTHGFLIASVYGITAPIVVDHTHSETLPCLSFQNLSQLVADDIIVNDIKLNVYMIRRCFQIGKEPVERLLWACEDLDSVLRVNQRASVGIEESHESENAFGVVCLCRSDVLLHRLTYGVEIERSRGLFLAADAEFKNPFFLSLVASESHVNTETHCRNEEEDDCPSQCTNRVMLFGGYEQHDLIHRIDVENNQQSI